jgi:hypothetical protein
LVRDNSVFSRKGKSTATAGDFAVGDKVVARVSQRGAERPRSLAA